MILDPQYDFLQLLTGQEFGSDSKFDTGEGGLPVLQLLSSSDKAMSVDPQMGEV